jgi:2-polyprenyl-6-methoxyphenol hydroxylase-like FAD-dependent oxidoreductase
MVNMAAKAGANLRFLARVTDVDPDEATVWFTDPSLTEHQIKADMVVFADGLHSLGDKLALKSRTADYYMKPESRSCVTGMIYPESGHKLSLNHIHFWNELASDSMAIGIPNIDGSIAILLISDYSDLGPDELPFATPEQAKLRLERDFPQMLKHDPNMIHYLSGRRRYKFHYKAASTFKIGDRSVIVGDAGMVMPPWAGFGANSAMVSAAALVYHLINNKANLEDSFEDYNNQQTFLARYVLDYVKGLGDYLSGPVTEKPDEKTDPELPALVKRAQESAAEIKSRTQQPSLA